jgi:hypothetical protein
MMFARKASFLLFLILPLAESFQVGTPGLFGLKQHAVVEKVSYRDTRVLTSQSSGNEPERNSLLTAIDKAGLSLKPQAVKTSQNIRTATSKGKKALMIVQSCFLYSLFILYRGYRGFFVILPAVFRQVYNKLQTAVDAPFVEGNRGDNEPMPWQSRVTVSVLAAVLTASYVLGGAFRVVQTFFRTIAKTSDVSGSFAAAADAQEINEDKILRMTKKERLNGENASMRDSDNEPETPPPPRGLSP